MASSLRLRYADQAEGPWLEVRVIHTWERGDVPEQVMSSSSGPKDLFKNMVWQLFNVGPQVERVAMVRGGGPMFFILRIGSAWFDASGKKIVASSHGGS